MKTARRVSQILFLFVFLLLFVLTVGRVDYSTGSLGLAGRMPVDMFLRLDPLAALGTMLSSRTFLVGVLLWAVPVLLLAVFFGRAFCGWICPLGTCIDGCDHLVREKKSRRTTREICWPKLKYYVLAGFIVTAFFGAQLFWLFDPIPLLVRGLTLGVFAPLQWLLRQAAEIPGIGRVLRVATSAFLPEQQMNFHSNLAALTMLLAVLFAGVISRRFWCRSLCPLGALLGIVARVSIFRRDVKPSCSECTLCELDCKMDAVGAKGRMNNPSECIYCFSCVKACPKNAASIAPAPRAEAVPLNLSRRHLLAGLGLGAAWGLSARTAMAVRPTRDATSRIAGMHLVRPPGSVAEGIFTERCIRCGECMKVCPTNGLQPALSEAGLGGIWTPVLVPRAGECTQMCNLCGQVCPTEAIQPFTIPEKDYLYIGRAAINRSTCVVWESGRDCLVCDEVCSYDAIYWVVEGGTKRPHVDSARCVGCGICENNCPVGGPNAAIRVYSDGDKRSMPREQQKAWRQANLVQHDEPAPGEQPR